MSVYFRDWLLNITEIKTLKRFKKTRGKLRLSVQEYTLIYRAVSEENQV